MASFIKDSYIGYGCVRFVDTKDTIRWGIDRSWDDAGNQVSARATSAFANSDLPSFEVRAAVVRELAEQLVEIVADPGRHTHIPAWSSALMDALGIRCYCVVAERETLQVLDIREIPGTPAQADQLLDDETGADAVRTKYDGSSYEIAIPVDAMSRGLSADELAISLPKELAEDLADNLAALRIQVRISNAMSGGRAL